MDFNESIWYTLIAPLIVLILSPLATSIGNEILKRKWNWKAALYNTVILSLLLIVFPITVFFECRQLEKQWNFLLPYIEYVSPFILKALSWFFHGLVIILVVFFILILFGIGYYFASNGRNIDTLQEEIEELVYFNIDEQSVKTLILIFLLATIALGYKLIIGALNVSTWIHYECIIILFILTSGAAYFYSKGGGDIGMVQEKIRELTKK
ncbi:hypothetical protein [Methanosarcina sp.]|uniref:hypothetical protein n=1 Tax=Methanosarcina sp. TaxID=2213 RepID=UPI003C735889